MTYSVTPRGAASRLPRLGRRGLILVAMTVIAAGMWMNWGWLAAVGAAPLILSLAPCAVMCGLGLCMMGGTKSCAAPTSSDSGPQSAKD